MNNLLLILVVFDFYFALFSFKYYMPVGVREMVQ